MKVVILMGSESDQPHADRIRAKLDELGVAHESMARSAHKDPRAVLEKVESYADEEKVVFVTIAGRSNALSGVVAGSTQHPVLACPPFKDKSDYLVNIHSTLQMPSNTPVMCVIDPANCAISAARILGVK